MSFQFPESSKIVDYSVESNSSAVESNLFPISCRGSDPLTCVEQINLQKDKSGSKVAGNEHSINVACSKANWDEDDNSNDLETSDNSKEHETVASLNHLSPQSKSNDLENRDNPKEHETVSSSNRLTPRPQFSCIGPNFFYRPPTPIFTYLSKFKKAGLLKAKKRLKVQNVTVVHLEISDDEIEATFKTELGLQNTVTVTQSSVTCTCTEHDKDYYCSEIVRMFDLLKLPKLSQKLVFSVEEFCLLKDRAKILQLTSMDKGEVVWRIEKFKKNVTCGSCKEKVSAGSLVGSWQIQKNEVSPSSCLPAKRAEQEESFDCVFSE